MTKTKNPWIASSGWAETNDSNQVIKLSNPADLSAGLEKIAE
jgi:hypothetical protein